MKTKRTMSELGYVRWVGYDNSLSYMVFGAKQDSDMFSHNLNKKIAPTGWDTLD